MSELSEIVAELRKNGTIVGHRISYDFNDTDMWKNDDPRLPKCPRCGIRTEFFATNPDYKPKKRYKPDYAPELAINEKTSLSATYDGQTIASRAFRDWCAKQGYSGLEFRELPVDPSHFHFLVNNVVPFDPETAHSRFENYCPECKNFNAVAVGFYILKVSSPLSDGIYRTDMLFAGGKEKHPLFIVGAETKAKMLAAKMKGLDFDPVYASPAMLETP
ncbi:MAG: hypothetical protein P4L33_06040 [Capsulimonadaceae bacterium]|nr:hypothetical protein [Capsulimonadaceae bacterium]